MNAIESAKADFLQAKEALLRALANTPDDRLNWSPSPTSRTILQQAAHSASAIGMIQAQMSGHVFEHEAADAADKHFRDWERQFTDRKQVVDLIEEKSDSFIAYLDSLSPEDLEGNWTLPFGLGEAPRGMTLGVPAMHTRSHIAQIDYIQTIYGDHDWHMGAPA